jgi:hypothetical protein
MKHLTALADTLKARFDMPVVIEPNRAAGTQLIRILPSDIVLQQAAQASGQTDVPYHAIVKLVVSFRLQGANEQLSLTNQSIALDIRISEYFNDDIELATQRDGIDDGLAVSGEAIISGAKKMNSNSGFAGLSDDSGKENKLFIYREDWQMQLRVRVLRVHNPPILQQITINNLTTAEPVTREPQ